MKGIHAQIGAEYGWLARMHKELLARGLRVGKQRVRLLRSALDCLSPPEYEEC